MLAKNVLEHLTHYKSDNIDKTYIPTYFYLEGAGTGKSRHASEFASSIQNAIPLCNKHPLYPELKQRFKAPYVFNISFENGTPLTVEERSDPWNAIGVRMLHQLLDEPIDHIRNRYVEDPRAVFRLVAAADNVDLHNEFFTGILVMDGIMKVLTDFHDGRNNLNFESALDGLLNETGGLSLMTRYPSEPKGSDWVWAGCRGVGRLLD